MRPVCELTALPQRCETPDWVWGQYPISGTCPWREFLRLAPNARLTRKIRSVWGLTLFSGALWRSRRGSRSRGAGQAIADGAACPLEGAHAVPTFESAVRTAEQAVELPCELLRVDRRVDLARCLGLTDRALEAVAPVVLFRQH